MHVPDQSRRNSGGFRGSRRAVGSRAGDDEAPAPKAPEKKPGKRKREAPEPAPPADPVDDALIARTFAGVDVSQAPTATRRVLELFCRKEPRPEGKVERFKV